MSNYQIQIFSVFVLGLLYAISGTFWGLYASTVGAPLWWSFIATIAMTLAVVGSIFGRFFI